MDVIVRQADVVFRNGDGATLRVPDGPADVEFYIPRSVDIPAVVSTVTAKGGLPYVAGGTYYCDKAVFVRYMKRILRAMEAGDYAYIPDWFR